MKTRFFSWFVLFTLLCPAAVFAAAAPRTIRVEWQYGAAVADLAGFRLYMNGARTCEIPDPAARAADCQVAMPDAPTVFTMTAYAKTGLESPPSPLYALSADGTPDRPPVAFSQTYGVNENELLTGTLNASDPEGASLSYTVTSLSGNYREFSWTQSGSLTFMPDRPGTFAFLFHASDGLNNSNEATVTVVIHAVNHPPIATNDTASTKENRAVNVAVLANDSDPDLDSLALTAVTQPLHGSAAATGGNVVYTPENGFVGTDTYSYTITDPAGATASATVQITVYPAVDAIPPAVTAPTDILTSATGLYTALELGTAAAYDAVDGTLTPVPDRTGPFLPGTHVVTWTAVDTSGNRGSARQTVRILPLASFGPGQISGEGRTVRIPVFLNGPAPYYPVTIPFTISGTATRSADHNAPSGTLVIAAGLEGAIDVSIAADSLPEADETIVFSMEKPENAIRGARTTHTVTITETNVQPTVRIMPTQDGVPTRTVYPSRGMATISAAILDPNRLDRHTVDWAGTDSRLLPPAGTAANSFSFSPAALPAGIYLIQARITDNGSPALSTINNSLIRIAGSTEIPAGSFADQDLDGLPDSIDPDNLRFVLPINANGPTGNVLETEPGVLLRLGAIALSATSPDASIDSADISRFESETDSNPDYANDGVYYESIVDFELSDLPQPGTVAKLVLPIYGGIPAHAVYRKYLPGTGWVDYSLDEYNRVASAYGEAGTCPPAGSPAYLDGLAVGDTCIQLTIQDGGPNDVDRQVNGIIKDPSGLGVVPAAETVTTESPAISLKKTFGSRLRRRVGVLNLE